MPKINKLSTRVNKTSNKANSMLHETIDSFTEIKRSHTEKVEVKKFTVCSQVLYIEPIWRFK